MGMMLGATVYVFSIILAVFLVGLAMGSAGGSWLLRRVERRALALGWCQMLLALAIAWTAYPIAHSLPYWPIDPLLSRVRGTRLSARYGALSVGDAAGGAALGREFPACAGGRFASARGIRAIGGRRLCGQHLGAIVGALCVSLVLVPWIGTQQTQRLLVMLALAERRCWCWCRMPRRKRDRFAGAMLAASLACRGVAGLAGRTDPGRS